MTNPEAPLPKTDTIRPVLDDALAKIGAFLDTNHKVHFRYGQRDEEYSSATWRDAQIPGSLYLNVQARAAYDGLWSEDTITVSDADSLASRTLVIQGESTIDGRVVTTKIHETDTTGERITREVTQTDLEEIGTLCEIATADIERYETIRQRHSRHEPYHLTSNDWLSKLETTELDLSMADTDIK